ncbi:hypothetical protein BFJ63_vAg18290 [Fusarium oxysporum f. sp. narcissi]|uniref:Uncharacterized protein n=2 Tax=Fusarium oxysporum TaxID=5507 RepID=A0A420NDS9_FUSOX|nr:hypothetical protein BFJ71_g16494 [Fusarium oxysporum]RKK89676.1 hypothetical protein BFJ68_g16656 [Fusarium oxysporum]RKL08275.1 hypothetical protein BFJ70_g16828 [Fusarium oxysporum]RYC78837.1 hypothetical protein BFJ63_vAg18290 [Fusarium oxysporum f. sp. narcissi]
MRRRVEWKIHDWLIDHVILILERPVPPQMSLPELIAAYWALFQEGGVVPFGTS